MPRVGKDPVAFWLLLADVYFHNCISPVLDHTGSIVVVDVVDNHWLVCCCCCGYGKSASVLVFVMQLSLVPFINMAFSETVFI